MLNYNDVSGRYFLFLGSNSNTGKPNRLTGKFSYSGSFHSFSTKEKAYEFRMYNYRYYSIVSIGSAKSLRRFSLGLSVNDFIEHLLCLPYSDL